MVDSEVATWADAHDTFITRGGHVPTSAEMAELILQLSRNHPHRCIYYPRDLGYNGPAEADCNGGCSELALTGG